MTAQTVTRRLAAILAADMVGFSRLVQLDEAGTLARQKSILRTVIQPRIAEHAGRLFKTTGDGFLVEFSSAVEALNCAADIQRDMALHEDDAPEDRQIAYRIGINVGEIIADDGDVFGDGVNIAARLEVEADPGGILVSETVFRTVRGKLDLGFEDIGPQTVKNIADPVQAYHVLLDPEDAGQVFTAQPRRRLPWLIGAVGVLIAALLAVFLFLPTNEEVAEDPVPPEPVALRLLVLPYMAQDPDGEVYADATSENLWLTLSRLRDLETVTRSDALTLEGIDPTPEQIAAFGAVSHVLDGQVAVQNGQITLTSRLRDAAGAVVWEQTGMIPEAGLLAEVARHKTAMTSALKIPLNATERALLEQTYTDSPQAFLDFARATNLLQTYHWNNFPQALTLFEQALAARPGFVEAQAGYAQINYDIWRAEWSNVRNTRTAMEIAEQAADAALALEPNHPQAMTVKVFIRMHLGRFDEALVLAQGAMFRNSDAPLTHRALGWALLASGQTETAVAEFDTYLATAPRLRAMDVMSVANAWVVLGRPEQALTLLSTVEGDPNNRLGRAVIAAIALVRAGQVETAQQYMAAVMQGVPFANLQWWRHLMDHYADPAVWNSLATDLAAAGMPEWPFAYDVAHASDRLGHDELVALFETGFNSINGFDELGGELRLTVSPDGRIEFANSYLADKYTGAWRVDGDLVCLTFADLYKGREVCEQIYRDPENLARRIVMLTSFGLRKLGVSPFQAGPDR